MRDDVKISEKIKKLKGATLRKDTLESGKTIYAIYEDGEDEEIWWCDVEDGEPDRMVEKWNSSELWNYKIEI